MYTDLPTLSKSSHQVLKATLCFSPLSQLNDLQLVHLEALHRQRDEIDAKHAGEMAYLKLHHQEQLGDLQARHREEVLPSARCYSTGYMRELCLCVT